MHVDEILEDIGYGLLQRFVLGCCCMVALMEGFLSTAVFYVLPHISCELYSTWDQLIIAYTPFINGYCLGAFYYGGVSDISGRRYTLGICSIITFVGAILLAASSSLLLAGLSMFLLGMSLAGVHIGCRVVYFEVLPPSCRGSHVVVVTGISTVGSILAILVMHLFGNEKVMMPLDSKWMSLILPPWRSIMVIGGVASLLGACAVSLLPVTPRQMLAHLKVVTAAITLRKFYALNKCENEEKYPHYNVKHFEHTETRLYHRRQCTDYLIYFFRCILSYTVEIFKMPRTINACLLLLLHILLFDGSMVLTSLLGERLVYSENCTLSGGRVVNETLWEGICGSDPVSIYQLNLYLGLTLIIPVVILVAFIDYLPRNIILALSCLSAGLGAFLLSLIYRKPWDLVFAAFTVCCHFVALATLQILTLEIFPTKFRGTAYGLMTASSRIFQLAVLFTSDTSCSSTFNIFSYLFLAAAVAALLIREPDHKILSE